MEQSTTIDLPAKGIDIPFPVVPEDTEEMLSHKEDFARWLLLKDEDVDEIEGYSEHTTKRTMYRVGYFERWAWTNEDEYTPDS